MQAINHIDSELHSDERSLSRSEVRDVLTCFLAGEMTDDQVRRWAESFEFSESVWYERGFEEEIGRVVFVLGNPELVDGSLNNQLAAHLIRYLDRLSSG